MKKAARVKQIVKEEIELLSLSELKVMIDKQLFVVKVF